jgi:transcriptional regulator with XRE-family HTH domain
MRLVLGRQSKQARLALRLTQRQVATAVGVSRGYIANIEGGRANPTLAIVDRLSRVLELDAELVLRRPAISPTDGLRGPTGQRDLVHARCSGYAERRLTAAGWQVAREAEVVQGRAHGWIDLLALHPRTEALLVIEIKTRLDDLGLVERQVGWYGRSAADVARRLGWRPRRVVSWLLLLASDEVEWSIRNNREALGTSFPMRAREMLAWLQGDHPVAGRGLALIDPSSKRRKWLLRSRVDGRRSGARFPDYASAARQMSARGRPATGRETGD